MAQAAANNPANQQGRGKSFENQSASSTASSGVGSSISSSGSNVGAAGGGGGSTTPSVVKKYMEQRYGANTPGAPGTPGAGVDKNSPAKNGAPKTGAAAATGGPPSSASGIFNQSFTQNLFGSANGAEGGLSSLTSQFTSGIANLKLTASNFQTNKLTSKIMNPFSSS